MSRKVLILDTSVLCCLLKVPGKTTAGPSNDSWDFKRIDNLLEMERKNGSTFVLPTATLIETGNHIAQCSDFRFELATALCGILKSAAGAESPWAPFNDQSELWETANLIELADKWPTFAAKKMSIGDTTIKHVAEHYAAAGMNVEILTGDQGLKAYQPVHKISIPRRRR